MNAESPINALIAKLQKLDEIFAKEEYKRFLSEDNFVIDKHDIDDANLAREVDEIEALADENLISSDGGCRWDMHRVLATAGYNVRPGEQDSFGWLTGIINGKNFRFVYG